MTGWVGSTMCSTSSDEANIGEKNRERMENAFKTYGCNKTLFLELEASYAYLRTTTDEEVYCNVSLRPTVSANVSGVITEWPDADCNVAKGLFNAACTMAPTNICASDESEDGEVSELQRMNNTYESYQCSDNANEKVQPYLAEPLPDVTANESVAKCLNEYAAAAIPVAPAARPPALADPADLQALTHSGPPPVPCFPETEGK